MSNPIHEALRLARSGDVSGALACLAGSSAPGVASLEFTLLEASGELEKAIEKATQRLATAGEDRELSLWTLRRGLLHLETGARKEALTDLSAVLKLRSNDDHCKQAREAMSRTLTRRAPPL